MSLSYLCSFFFFFSHLLVLAALLCSAYAPFPSYCSPPLLLLLSPPLRPSHPPSLPPSHHGDNNSSSADEVAKNTARKTATMPIIERRAPSMPTTPEIEARPLNPPLIELVTPRT